MKKHVTEGAGKTVSGADITPAEKAFLRAFRESKMQENQGMLKAIFSLARVQLKTGQPQERQAVEKLARDQMKYVLQTAAQKYYFREVMKIAAEQTAGQPDANQPNASQITAQLKNAFEIKPYKSDVKVAKKNAADPNIVLVFDNVPSPFVASRRTSDRIEQSIAGALPERLSDKSRDIARTALARTRAKMDMLDDVIKEAGGETAHKKLNALLKKALSSPATPEMTFYDAWESGKFCHETALCKNQADADALAELLSFAFKQNIAEFKPFYSIKPLPPGLSASNIELACDRFTHRLLKHDQAIMHRPVAGQALSAASPLALPLPPSKRAAFALDKESQDILLLLRHHAAGSARNGIIAATLLQAVDATMQEARLTQDDAVIKAASMMLSPFNLMNAAKSLGVEGPLKGHKYVGSAHLHENAQQLQTLYAASPETQGFVNQALSDARVMLLAPLALKEATYRGALAPYLSTLQERQGVTDEITARRKKINASGLSEAEVLTQFPDDTDAVKLTRDLSILSALDRHAALVTTNIARALQQVVTGTKPDKVSPVPVEQTERHYVKSRAPAGWAKSFGAEFAYEVFSGNKDHFIIRSKLFPDKISDDLPYNASEGTIRKTLGHLREECEYHRSNRQLIGELTAQRGFESRVVEGKTVLKHQGFAIDVPLSGSEEAMHQQLLATQKLWEKAMTAPKQAAPSSAAVTFPTSAILKQEDRKTAVAPVQWLPNEGETLIMFDTATLTKFAIPRGDNGHSWLDMIKATARLPNVRVIIPEYIADWEMQGRIPSFNEQGNRTGTKIVDSRFNRHDHILARQAHMFRQFLEGASYGKMQDDGTIMLDEGVNKNIIVVSSPSDKKLFALINSLDKHTAHETHEAIGNTVYKHDLGESAINYILKNVRFKAPFIAVSDDINYLKKDALHETGAGSSVSHAGGRDYFNAEIGAGRAGTIGSEMNSYVPISEQALQTASILFCHDNNGQYRRLYGHHTSLIDAHTGKMNDIYEVIHEGTQLARAGVAKNGNGIKNWTAAVDERRQADMEAGKNGLGKS